MKKITVFISLFLTVNTLQATTVSGLLVGGGGIDDMRLEISSETGRSISVYCTSKCGPWFAAPDNNDVVHLKKSLRGKRVTIEYVTEPNRGRIAGPGDTDPVNLMQSLRFVK